MSQVGASNSSPMAYCEDMPEQTNYTVYRGKKTGK
jgi:hypothetical protein